MATLFGLEIADVDLDTAAERVADLGCSARVSVVVTPNVDHLRLLQQNTGFHDAYDMATLRLPDGKPLQWMASWTHQTIHHRVTGADLLPALCAVAARRGLRVAIIGGSPGTARLAGLNMTRRFPALRISATWAPAPGFQDDATQCHEILNLLKTADAQIIFVCLGAPKQELWVARWRRELPFGAYVCVGGAVDYAAGTTRRAPRWVQVVAFEWLFRLLCDPKRLCRRYAQDFLFLTKCALVYSRPRAARRGTYSSSLI